jgi:hypothetical protein
MNPSPAFIVYTASLLTVAACLMLIIIRSLLAQRAHSPETLSNMRPTESRSGVFFVLVLLFGLLVAGYYVLRYHGLWTENDTATITQTIESMREQAVLLPSRFVYQHGFGYQVTSITLVFFTGLTTQSLQTILFPFLAAAGLILTSYIFFREVLHNNLAAALASMLLVFQPDILFVTLRGSHEKITWQLMMLALAILYRSFGQPLRKMIIYVPLFYLVVFAIDTTNIFFGSVFLVAVVLSMALGFFLLQFWRNRRPPLPRQDVRRLMYISLSGCILIFIFIVYIYPPALANLRMLNNIFDQLSALLLSFEIKAQPYGYISTGWVNPRIYLLLTIFTWLIIAASFLVWLRHGWKLFKGDAARGLVENLDWLLYTGFAIQIAVSIMVDFSGFLGANMQLRLFPSFTVMAIVLLVRALIRVLSSVEMRIVTRRIIFGASAALSAWFILASVLKATNESSLSNKWTFYQPAEKASIQWTETHLRDADLWTGVDERLQTIFASYYRVDSKSQNTYRFGKVNPDTQFVLDSEWGRLLVDRLGIHMLPVTYWDLIYDNGHAQVDRIPLYLLETP